MYRISYSNGEILVEMEKTNSGYIAQFRGEKGFTPFIALTSIDELYDRCIEWASSNIQGEFTIEPKLSSIEISNEI